MKARGAGAPAGRAQAGTTRTRRVWAPGSRGALTALAVLVAIACWLGGRAAHAAEASPLGLWKTVDESGTARGYVRIYEEAGRLHGRIERPAIDGYDAGVCHRCTDERKGKPIIGLVIIRNVMLERGEYRGGDILDPDTGTVYRVSMRTDDAGRKLIVRGYLGISLFGRSQTWLRAD